VTTAQPDADPVIDRLIAWAGERDEIRAMLLMSNRAVPGATVDALSDYDVILVVRNIGPFVASHGWLNDFGDVLVAYWNPIFTNEDHSYEVSGNVTQYRDGLKIDFTLWPVALLTAIVGMPALPDELDAGYRVLLDRDGLTAGLRPPTHNAYCPVRPDEVAFRTAVNDFFTDVPYVAKCLLRDDLLPMKWALDHDMKHVYLRLMLGWWDGCAEGWLKPVGSLGKGLRRRRPADIWREVEASYAGGGLAGNREALFSTIANYRRVASEVADQLGYRYPDALDQDVTEFARRMLAGDVGHS